MRCLVLLALLAGGADTVDLWIRSPGEHAGEAPPGRTRPIRAALGALPTRELERLDVQSGTVERYRGFSLHVLIDRYHPPPSTDLALLHFANGMIVPLPFRDRAVMQRLDPFVARWVWRDGRWSTQLPPVQRARPPAKDVQPLAFTGNKLVVLDPAHPFVGAGAQRDFSPFSYVDTLVGIELVESTAYFAQFETPAAPELARAAHIYRESCGFCHGLGGVGARMGPDLVEPVPAPDYLGRRAFFLHLRFRPADAPARGLVMPVFSHLDERDAQLVRRWLGRIAGRGTARYAPREQ